MEPPSESSPTPDPHQASRLRSVQLRTDELVRLRVLMVALMRLLGILVALSCMVPVGSWLAEGIADGDLWWLGYYWPRIGLGAFLLVMGVGLFAFAGVLGVALVRHRPGPVACPMCKFELTTLDNGRCTECGYELSPALPPLGVSAHERVLAVRIVVFALVRLIALATLGMAANALIRFVGLAYTSNPGYSYGYGTAEAALSALSLVWAIVWCAVAAILWLLAGPLTAAMVPGVWIRELAEARRGDA